MWDLIVSVPDHCLSFYFQRCGTEGLIISGLQTPQSGPKMTMFY